MKLVSFSFLLCTATFLSYAMDEKEIFNKNMQLLSPCLRQSVCEVEIMLKIHKKEVHAWINPYGHPVVLFGNLTDALKRKGDEFNPRAVNDDEKKESTTFIAAINYLKKQSNS